jgi:GGDEF domain-containing protein
VHDRALDDNVGDFGGFGERDEPTGEAREPARTWPPAGHDPADTRGRESLWVGALEDEIARSRATGSPLSLLLAELDDAERVAMAESPGEAGATFGGFARAVRSAVRRSEILACESDARAWIIAPDTPRSGARALGARIATAVEQAPPWRGAPLVASIGVAVLGEDGTTGADLIAAAEEAWFRASANGAHLAPASPEGES